MTTYRIKVPTKRRAVVVVGAMARVPKEAVDLEQTKLDLTVSNASYWATANAGLPVPKGKQPQIELFKETDEYIWVPRHYELPLLRPVLRVRYFGGKRRSGPTNEIAPRNKIQRQALKALAIEKDKILALACGVGKTVVSLKGASDEQRFPLLVVVHTNALMDQWRKQVKALYGVTDEEIGHVQGSVADWRGKKVVVGMLHTLVQRVFEPEFYRYFDLIIFDECHRLGAEYFSRVCSLFHGERWGLSATVRREDGMDKVFRLHLGAVAYEYLEQDLKAECYFIPTNVRVDSGQYMFRRGRVNLARLTTNLAKNEARNALIMARINKAAQDGRTVLVLGERVQQLYELHDKCTISSKAVHVGAMDAESRREALTKQVVFASQQLAKEGLDRPAFDTLFILYPFAGEGRFRQSTGRILRTMDGKKQAIVVVFVDTIGIMEALANKMRRHSRKLGFKVHNVNQRRAA